MKCGYMNLHPNPAFNFFMNRLAWTNSPDELREVGTRIVTMEEWVCEMLEAAKKAEAEGRPRRGFHPPDPDLTSRDLLGGILEKAA